MLRAKPKVLSSQAVKQNHFLEPGTQLPGGATIAGQNASGGRRRRPKNAFAGAGLAMVAASGAKIPISKPSHLKRRAVGNAILDAERQKRRNRLNDTRSRT